MKFQNLFPLREKEIFETLKKIKDSEFVLIGGYAVTSYTLPRFSVDCDIVVDDVAYSKKIGKELEKGIPRTCIKHRHYCGLPIRN